MKPTITKEQATSLAVNYQSYLEASRDRDYLGLYAWGSSLKTIQQEIGITLVDDTTLDFWINRAASLDQPRMV